MENKIEKLLKENMENGLNINQLAAKFLHGMLISSEPFYYEGDEEICNNDLSSKVKNCFRLANLFINEGNIQMLDQIKRWEDEIEKANK